MNIRTITPDDTENFFLMLCRLDDETEYMMYEPGERQNRTKNLSRLKTVIESAAAGEDLLLVAENDEREIVGFLHAERGKLNRISHTAYVVIGIRPYYQHRGIGTELFRKLDEWAEKNGVVRLELTVECENIVGKKLYEKQGFQVEGIRSKSMKVNGRFVDEYYMAKIFI